MPSDAVAWVFPGQGAQSRDMLEPFRAAPGLARRYATACGLLGFDPLERAGAEPEVLNQNRVSSLLTVTASLCAMELETAEPVAVAGYSIGQWTALCAAGVVREEALLRIVDARARLMDEALANQPPSGMLAVIGVALSAVEALCAAARERGHWVAVSNVNAPAQMTLGGEAAALDWIEEALRAKRPKRVVRVPVAGAWHGDLMEPAVRPFAEFLATQTLSAPRLPVIDNVTGTAMAALTPETLALQLARPVLWAPGVEALRDLGACVLIEQGYGDILTKFGFFIDRCLTHRAAAPPRQARG